MAWQTQLSRTPGIPELARDIAVDLGIGIPRGNSGNQVCPSSGARILRFEFQHRVSQVEPPRVNPNHGDNRLAVCQFRGSHATGSQPVRALAKSGFEKHGVRRFVDEPNRFHHALPMLVA